MSKHPRRRHRKLESRIPWRAALRPLEAAAAHPRRASLAVLLGLFLCWIVMTGSLPYALAPTGPDLALTLNPRNPAALLSKAGSVRDRLLSQVTARARSPAEDQGRAVEAPDSDNGEGEATLATLPKAREEAAAGHVQPEGLREALRKQVQQLAAKALAGDPLNAAAYRLLAEMASGPERVRALMQEAVRRSRRETAAVLWLLNDSYYRQDFEQTIHYADILVRTRPQMAKYGFNYLLNISKDAEGRRLAAAWLAQEPNWRGAFLGKLWDLARGDAAGIALVAELRNTKKPANIGEIRQYINHMAWQGPTDAAYAMWLQTLPSERLDTLGFLTDPGFEAEPLESLTVFDWAVTSGVNGEAGFAPSGKPGRQRLLHLSFGQGRIEFPLIRQVLVLPQGHYRLEGQLRGSIIGKRGLRWRLSCIYAEEAILGETDMLLGESEEWRVFSMEAEVPDRAGCAVGQVLRLVHDARSDSERFLSGEAWFGGLRLEQTAGKKNAARQ